MHLAPFLCCRSLCGLGSAAHVALRCHDQTHLNSRYFLRQSIGQSDIALCFRRHVVGSERCTRLGDIAIRRPQKAGVIEISGGLPCWTVYRSISSGHSSALRTKAAFPQPRAGSDAPSRRSASWFAASRFSSASPSLTAAAVIPG
ncbi:hypothetical protein RHECNPAF_2940052 [Rhizobium etli CNPAF512]|nr:hypothetical protein RHECNPAF_2940052 [Rhizobium etli CNPAF512]